MLNRLTKAVAIVMMLVPAPLLALAKKGQSIVVVADTRGLSGWRAFFSNLYNDSHLLFAVLTVTTIPLLALFLGWVTSWCLGRLGINLRTRQLSEH